MDNNFDYDPMIFLRCHSKSDKDLTDTRTQVWQACFEPIVNPKWVATCGGNKICIIDVEDGEVAQRYTGEDKDVLYALAWKAHSTRGENTSILATGGAQNTIYFLSPNKKELLAHFDVNTSKPKSPIFSLLFHPDQPNILFCALQTDGISIINVNLEEEHEDISQHQVVSCDYEITRLAICEAVLLAATEDGLYGFTYDPVKTDRKWLSTSRYRLPTSPYNPDESDGFDLVDSVEVLKDGLVACKCVLHRAIYIFNIRCQDNSQSENVINVVPSYTLKWCDTDNYYMEISANCDLGLLSCGGTSGSIWLYDISCIQANKRNNKVNEIEPVNQLLWPEVNDVYLAKARKLDLRADDIIISKATIHPKGNYIVAVTNNNTVCIWKKV